ncbi:hypothetical protein ACFQBQ_01830 [Granulicella cerasi]|uniref:Uncharacterized protein n=1 Tax=Granulicella cerasi TaxID=741063 RepID=A0ABW1Z6R0_9BACT|nr:hypothetical protein [Granulicella cerasi]
MAAFTPSRLLLATLAVACVFASGCKAREMGVKYADKRAAHVDTTWLLAANACWPDLAHAGYTLGDVKSYLSDPLHFRATFAAYASLSNDELITVAETPVMKAPLPDSGIFNQSQNPVLTRQQALQGNNARGTLVSDTNGIAPQDSLCAIQAGTPVGFR